MPQNNSLTEDTKTANDSSDSSYEQAPHFQSPKLIMSNTLLMLPIMMSSSTKTESNLTTELPREKVIKKDRL